MKKILIIVLFTFTAVPLYAQDDWTGIVENMVRAVEKSRRLYDIKGYSVEGSPFYNRTWKKGYAITKNGALSEIYKFKYDIFKNRLLIKANDGVYIVRPNLIKGFILVDNEVKTPFKKGFSSNEHDIKPGKYLRIIYDGKLKLAVNYKVSTREKKDIYTGERTLIFDNDKWYYLITSGGAFHEIDLEKDDILEVLGKYQNELEKYADKKDLSFEDEQELAAILAYYEGLAFGNK